MNELREKIETLVQDGEHRTEEVTDAILDAVIAALPFASADDEDGYVAAISEVTSLLEAAKENK